jgi:hypothetical protein
MSINAQIERRNSEKQQRRALIDRDQNFNHSKSVNRTPATSNGMRLITALEKLEPIEKTITVEHGEVKVFLRLSCEDPRVLQMVRLLYEIDGWAWNES